jgi:putative sterol carrier protein
MPSKSEECCQLGQADAQDGGAMSEATEEFFYELHHHGHGRLLKKTNATIRFDLVHGQEVDHWLVAITNGAAQVSREERAADTVIHTDEAFFERMARGEAKPVPAWLRNDITSEGEFRFIVLLERLFPPPPGARHPRAVAGYRGRPE